MRNDYNDHKQLDTHPEALNGGLVEGDVLVVRADHLPREGVLWGLLQLLQEAQQAGLQSLVRRLPLILVGEAGGGDTFCDCCVSCCRDTI